MRLKYFVLLLFVKFCYGSRHDLNVTEYFRMPPLYELDNYEECMGREDGLYCLVSLDLVAEHEDDLKNMIEEYSHNKLKRYNHSYIDRGICVTKRCRSHINYEIHNIYKDPSTVLDKCLNETIHNEYKLQAKLTKMLYCHNSKIGTGVKVDIGDWIFGSFVMLILMLNIYGTWYDFRLRRSCNEKTTENPYILSFSVMRNWNRLVTYKCSNPRQESFKGLNGLRTILSFFMIAAHTTWLIGCGFIDNPRDFEMAYEKPHFQLIFAGMTVIQVYFVMSGCLLVHGLKMREETRKESWTTFPFTIIFRLARISPSIIFLMGFTTTWFRHLGTGPLWNYYVGPVVSDCRQYWWAHILFVNILFEQDKYCAIQSWHISAEVQVFILGLFVYLTNRGRRRNLALAVLFIIGLVSPALHVWFQDLDATLLLTPEVFRTLLSDELRKLHIMAHNNLSSFVMGMFLGLYIYDAQRINKKFPKIKTLSILTSMVIPSLASFYYFTGNYFLAQTEPVALPIRLLYASLQRPFLGLVYGYLLLSLVFKFNNTISRILEWNGWLVPSKLSFMVYILHVNLIHYMLGVRTQLGHSSFFTLTMYHMTVVSTSFVMALPMYLVLEAPTTYLFKTIEQNILTTKSKKNTE